MRFRYWQCLAALGCAAFLVACSSSSSDSKKDEKENPAPEQYDVTLLTVDGGFSPLGSVEIFLPGSTAADATTAVDGTATLELDQVQVLEFRKAGYVPQTVSGAHWDTADGMTIFVWMPEQNVDGGTIAGTITGITGFDPLIIGTNAGAWITQSVNYSTPLPASPPTFLYSGHSAFGGKTSIFAFPQALNIPAADAFFGIKTGIDVTAGSALMGQDFALEYGGKTFTVTSAGGQNNASIGYQIFMQGVGELFSHTNELLAPTGMLAVTVPTNTGALNTTGAWLMTSDNIPLGDGSNKFLFARIQFNSRTELEAAASAQTITLVDRGLSAISPAHGATNVSLTPAISLAIAATDTLIVNVYIRKYTGTYAQTVWLGSMDPDAGPMTVPAGILAADTTYSLEVQALAWTPAGFTPTDINPRTSLNISGVNNIFFSTGATVTPF